MQRPSPVLVTGAPGFIGLYPDELLLGKAEGLVGLLLRIVRGHDGDELLSDVRVEGERSRLDHVVDGRRGAPAFHGVSD